MKLSNYGFIAIDKSYKEVEKAELNSSAFKTTVYCVGTIEQACEVAQKLVADNVQVIELCGAFKGDMPKEIIKAVDGKVPVGNMSYSETELPKLMAFLQK